MNKSIRSEIPLTFLLGAAFLTNSLPLSAASRITSITPSGCKPGDHLVTNEPMFDGVGPDAKVIPPKNTPGQQSLAVLGDVKASDGSTRIFVERVHGLPERDSDTRPGFTDAADSIRIACTEYQQTDYAQAPTIFVPAGEVWRERVVDLQKVTPRGEKVYVVARVDKVLDENTARVQWVDATTGEIITEVVSAKDLFSQRPAPK